MERWPYREVVTLRLLQMGMCGRGCLINFYHLYLLLGRGPSPPQGGSNPLSSQRIHSGNSPSHLTIEARLPYLTCSHPRCSRFVLCLFPWCAPRIIRSSTRAIASAHISASTRHLEAQKVRREGTYDRSVNNIITLLGWIRTYIISPQTRA